MFQAMRGPVTLAGAIVKEKQKMSRLLACSSAFVCFDDLESIVRATRLEPGTSQAAGNYRASHDAGFP
jgi:hypothetical protein